MTGDPFAAHRSLLFTVAYEMLGSAADAEDVLQESWLRWAGADRPQVRDQRAYLIRVVTRQALNRLRTLARSREDYVGEWLPEPLLTSPNVAGDVELADSVSKAGGADERIDLQSAGQAASTPGPGSNPTRSASTRRWKPWCGQSESRGRRPGRAR
jgi:DNA-directed RNA polymerase specialized sigma24 family protein